MCRGNPMGEVRLRIKITHVFRNCRKFLSHAASDESNFCNFFKTKVISIFNFTTKLAITFLKHKWKILF